MDTVPADLIDLARGRATPVWGAASGALKGLESTLAATEAAASATKGGGARVARTVASPAAAPASTPAAARAAAAPSVTSPTIAPKVDASGLASLGDAMQKAQGAMKFGEEVIGGAVAGMRAAISSLASGDVTGAIAGVTDTVSALAKSLDLIAPGLGQVVSAVVSIVGGLAGAFTGAITSLVKFSIASTEAKTASLAQWSAMGAGIITGEEVDSMLDKLRDSTGLTKDALGPLASEFLRMGITGQEALEGLTVAAASAEAVVKGGGQAFATLFQKVDAAAQTGSKLVLPFGKLQKSLIAAGLNVSDLAKQMGITEAALTSGLKAGTIDARKFGDAMTEAATKKGASPMATLANSAANLGKLLEEYLGDLFEDLGDDVAPFMAAVREAFGVLSSASPLGQSLKATIGDAMHSIFATLTKLVPVAREAFWTLVVWALKAYIAIAPIVFRIRDAITSAAGMKVLSNIGTAVLTAFKAVGIALAVVVGVIATIMVVSVAVGVAIWNVIATIVNAGIAAGAFVGRVIASVVAAVAGVISWVSGINDRIRGALQPIFDVMSSLFGQAVAIIATLLEPVVGFVQGVWDSIVGVFASAGAAVTGALASVWDSIASVFSADSATSIATGLIDGLVGGIAGGAARVADSLKNVGQSAIDGVKGILGIHSPSAVMMELGGHTAEGFARGVDDGSGRTQGSLTAAVAPPAATSSGGKGGGGGTGGGVTINVGGLTLHLGAGASNEVAAQLTEILPGAIARAFEEVAMQLGGATGNGEPA